MSVDGFGDVNQRNLSEHAKESVETDTVEGSGDDKLMHCGREEEDGEYCYSLGGPQAEKRVVHVSEQPVVHRQVPGPPIDINSAGITPILSNFIVMHRFRKS